MSGDYTIKTSLPQHIGSVAQGTVPAAMDTVPTYCVHSPADSCKEVGYFGSLNG